MKLVKNELRRFLYAFWMPVALLMVLGFLIFAFIKPYAGQAPHDALLFLLCDKKYHGILYALLALFIFGLEVESGAVDTQIMAGYSAEHIVLHKSALYFAVMLVLNCIYAVACMKICGIGLSTAWQSLTARLVIEVGTSAVFIILQLIFRELQPTLIISAASAVVFMIAATPKYELWYAAIGGILPWGVMIVSMVFGVLCTAVSVLWVKLRYK